MTEDNPQWFWNKCSDPFAKGATPEWIAYSAEDNNKIEESFQRKESKVDLANHSVHFKERMQVHKADFQRQRPIKREPRPT